MLTINNFAPGNTFVFGSDLRSTINNSSFFTFTITAIPEPSTYVLLAMAAADCGAHLLRRRKRGKVS